MTHWRANIRSIERALRKLLPPFTGNIAGTLPIFFDIPKRQ
jgi:hypothetical protein